MALKTITREEFDNRLEAAIVQRQANALSMEKRNQRITSIVSEIESALDALDEKSMQASNNMLREKLQRLSVATARFADTL